MSTSLRPKRLLAAVAAGILALSISACGDNATQVGAAEDAKTITIGTVTFDESIASSYLWKELLEQQGYEVKVVTLDVAPVYAGVANGQLDLAFNMSPHFHADYWETYGDDFDTLGVSYEGVSQAVAVPESLGITSMDELAGKASEVNNEIIGIEPGSGLMKDLHTKAVDAYGLQDFKIIDGSTPAMLAALEKSSKDGKPVAVTLWQPHWALGKFPVRILDDPKGVFGGSGDERTIASKDFADAYPDVAAQLAKYSTTPEQLQSLELAIAEAGQGNEQEAVRSWIAENQSFVDAWTQEA